MAQPIIPMDPDSQRYEIIETPPSGVKPMIIAETDDIDYAGEIVERLSASPLNPGYGYHFEEKE